MRAGRRAARARRVEPAPFAIRMRWPPDRSVGTILPLGVRCALTLPAIRIFQAISAAWKLRFREEMHLIGMRRPVWSSYSRDCPPVLSRAALTRIAAVARVFEAVNMLLPPERADAWMRSPNSARPFGGRSAVDLMVEDGRSGITVVCAYLLGEIHG